MGFVYPSHAILFAVLVFSGLPCLPLCRKVSLFMYVIHLLPSDNIPRSPVLLCQAPYASILESHSLGLAWKSEEEFLFAGSASFAEKGIWPKKRLCQMISPGRTYDENNNNQQ